MVWECSNCDWVGDESELGEITEDEALAEFMENPHPDDDPMDMVGRPLCPSCGSNQVFDMEG